LAERTDSLIAAWHLSFLFGKSIQINNDPKPAASITLGRKRMTQLAKATFY